MFQPRTNHDLKKVNITPLGAPGVDSNYLDWAFAAETYFEATGLDYVFEAFALKDWPPSWSTDNKSVSSTIVQICSEANYWYI